MAPCARGVSSRCWKRVDGPVGTHGENLQFRKHVTLESDRSHSLAGHLSAEDVVNY